MANKDLTDAELLGENLPTAAARPIRQADVDSRLSSGDWVEVDSSWARAARWRATDGKLLVRFKPSKDHPTGFVAGYSVPESTARSFYLAASKGKYIHSHLKHLTYTNET